MSMKYVLCVYEHVCVGVGHAKEIGAYVCVQVVGVVFRVGFQRALCGWWRSTAHGNHVQGVSSETAGTCSSAHAPWGQAVRCGEAVEHADVLRRQELHELGILKHFPLAVQDRRRLVRDVNNLPCDERDGYSKYILKQIS